MKNRFQELSAAIDERREAFHKLHPDCLFELIPLDLDFLTPEEREEFHAEKLRLPSFKEQKAAAIARLELKRQKLRDAKPKN